MIYYWRWLLRVIAIALVGLVEKAFGAPVLVLMMTFIYARRLGHSWRMGLLFLVSVELAVLFLKPLLLVWIGINLGYLFMRYGQKLLLSFSLRLWLSAGFGAALLWQPWGWGQVLYAIGVSALGIVYYRRYRLWQKK